MLLSSSPSLRLSLCLSVCLSLSDRWLPDITHQPASQPLILNITNDITLLFIATIIYKPKMSRCSIQQTKLIQRFSFYKKLKKQSKNKNQAAVNTGGTCTLAGRAAFVSPQTETRKRWHCKTTGHTRHTHLAPLPPPDSTCLHVVMVRKELNKIHTFI